jgi:hypothetical protein
MGLFDFIFGEKKKATERMRKEEQEAAARQETASEVMLKKAILEEQLSHQPDDAKQNISRAFVNVNCNFEFVIEVDFQKLKQHMDDANAKGFALVWADDGAKTTNGTAKIYSAGITHNSNNSASFQ